jgi:hypothetical protein
MTEDIMRYSALPTLVLAGALALGAAACERDTAAREPARDAGDAAREAAREAGASVAGAAETVDVKAALMRDDGVDASEINVDTDGTRKVVVLKGSVPTDGQRTRAAQIAEREAAGYRVDNQLVVRAR